MKSLPIEAEYYDPNTDEFLTKEEFIKRWNEDLERRKANV